MPDKNRLNWQDKDWATYLGCPVSRIPEIKQILDKNYFICVERNKVNNMYAMAVYRYDIAPSGHKRLRLLLSSNAKFKNVLSATQYVNTAVSGMELSDYVAQELNIPQKAIQMMLIRER